MAPQIPNGVHFLCMLLAVLAVQPLPSARAQDSLAVTCDDSPDGDSACSLILQRINDDLRQALTISKDSIMYTLEDNNSQKIDTGHSCSSTAEVRSRSATARIGTDIDIDLSGNALSEPVMLKLEVPVAISATVKVKQRFGFRVFGSCSNTGSDSFTFSGGGSTRAKAAVVLDLQPSFKQTSEGNFEVSVDPIVAVGLDVGDVDLDLKVSGVSPLNAVATFIHGFSSSLFRITYAAFTGEDVVELFKKSLAFDVAVPLGLSVLGGPAGDLVLDFIENQAERAIQRQNAGLTLVMEESLTAQVRKALGISGSGKRSFLISKDYKQTLLSGGSLSDIIASPKTTTVCAWYFRYQFSRGGGGGYVGTEAQGQRCTPDRAGRVIPGRNPDTDTYTGHCAPASRPPQFLHSKTPSEL